MYCNSSGMRLTGLLLANAIQRREEVTAINTEVVDPFPLAPEPAPNPEGHNRHERRANAAKKYRQ